METATEPEYYSAMAKVQGAPVSIRPDSDLVAEVDAWAATQGLKRHAAILALMRAGLAALAEDAERKKPLQGFGLAPATFTALMKTAPKPKATAPTLTVNLPLAGTFKRPIYQKGTKK